MRRSDLEGLEPFSYIDRSRAYACTSISNNPSNPSNFPISAGAGPSFSRSTRYACLAHEVRQSVHYLKERP